MAPKDVVEPGPVRGACLVAKCLQCPPMRRLASVSDRFLSHRRLWLVLAVLSPLLLLPAVHAGWQFDDHFHRSRIAGYGDANPIQIFVPYDGIPAHNLRQMEAGTLPWWASAKLHLAFLRYTSTISMLVDYELWPGHPEYMHLHSLLWLSAVVAAVTALYRRVFGPTWVAGLAALLYAVDEAHAWPANLPRESKRADRDATLAYLASSVSFAGGTARGGGVASSVRCCLQRHSRPARWRWRQWRICWHTHLSLDRGTFRERLAILLPHALVLAVWAVIYKAGEFGAQGSGFYVDPLADPLSFASSFFERARLLLTGQWTPIPAEMGLVYAPGSPKAIELRVIGFTVIAMLAGLFVPNDAAQPNRAFLGTRRPALARARRRRRPGESRAVLRRRGIHGPAGAVGADGLHDREH